jgi:glycosyltransferase involved in cell wall biosynthesis
VSPQHLEAANSVNPISIALDLSCVTDAQLTGIGYAALYQLRALFARDEPFEYRAVATCPRGGRRDLAGLESHLSRTTLLPHAGLIRYYLWGWFDWPPIEYFCGEAAIVHNFSHQVPATRHATRVVTVHDLSFVRVPETHTRRAIAIQTALIRQTVTRADVIVAVSKSCKDDLMDLYGVAADRIVHVPNGVNLDEFRATPQPDTLDALKKRLGIARDYFIHLGTIEPRKNIPRLIQAYGRVRQRYADCPQLVLVGKPGWKSQPSLDAMRPLMDRGDIVHPGYLAREEAVLLLGGATACVYPSLYEGFGLPVLEAMASHTPVLTSNVSSLPEVVGDTGLLVDPCDVDAIEAGLVALLDERATAEGRLAAAYDRAATFTWDRSACELASLYHRLASP